jgi:hypothetical protein
MKGDDHVNTATLGVQHPERALLFCAFNIRGSDPMAIGKAAKMIRLFMPVGHPKTAATKTASVR